MLGAVGHMQTGNRVPLPVQRAGKGMEPADRRPFPLVEIDRSRQAHPDLCETVRVDLVGNPGELGRGTDLVNASPLLRFGQEFAIPAGCLLEIGLCPLCKHLGVLPVITGV